MPSSTRPRSPSPTGLGSSFRTALRRFFTTVGRRPAPTAGALLPALDALRGVAVLAVFVQHFGDTHLPFLRSRIEARAPAVLVPWILTVLHHAHWGVDLFFVLSGFSLAQPFLARLARAAPLPPAPRASAPAPSHPAAPPSPTPWIAAFFRRRAARIYPAYLAALLLVVAVVPAVRRHPAFPGSALTHLLLLQGYLTPGGLVLIGAAWSLTTEASFYLAWPLLAPRLLAPRLPAAHPRRLVPSSSWSFGLALVALVWLARAALHEVALRPEAPPWLLEASQRRWAVSRLDQFVLGVLAAALHARLATTPLAARLRRLAPLLLLISAAALTGAFYLDGSFYLLPLGAWPYPLVSLATAAIVFFAVHTGDRAARWLFPAPLCAAGVVSYGLFLHHQLAIGLTARLAGPPGSWTAAGRHAVLALGLSFLLAILSWVALERPAMLWAARRTRPPR